MMRYCIGCSCASLIISCIITTYPGCCSEEREGGSKENIEKRKEDITNSHEGTNSHKGIKILLVKLMSAVCNFESSPAAGEIPIEETTTINCRIFIFFIHV